MNTRFCKNTFLLLAFIVCAAFSTTLHAQNEPNSDDLFTMARQAAFDKKDYNQAIALSRRALAKSPDYSDIRVFLGRVYTWSGKLDSARTEIRQVILRHPDNEDAYVAIIDLEYWNDNNTAALGYCEQALTYNPGSRSLLVRKIKVLKAEKKFIEAYRLATDVLQKNPADDEIRTLVLDINDAASRNKVGMGYNLSWFDRGFPDHLHNSPWHILSLDYTRSTSLGSVNGRVNYGTRFGNKAFQFELDAYPRICKGLYAYVNLGLSDTSSVFPRFRAGGSLYKALPYSFEAELGFRHLRFASSTWIYVGGISKYYKNYLFGGRVTLVPGANKVSHSYTGIIRYYYGGADDYAYLNLGYGISPDETNSVLAYNNGGYKLVSKGLTAGFKKSIRKVNIISFSTSLSQQEYKPLEKGLVLDCSLSFQRRF
ncbi:MAG TPA: YaiO family outer membrane beta-barrel protein [Paludibacter sp.]|nr:YaiO family outer membrane beta-barrel protein [Paludibacter sp.]